MDALLRRLAGRPPVPLLSGTHEVTDLMTGLYSRYLVRHPEPRERQRGILRRLWNREPYAPPAPPLCWDVDVVAGAWPPADEPGTDHTASAGVWLADIVEALTAAPAPSGVDLVRRCTPTIATLHAHGCWLRRTIPLLVRGGPGQPLPDDRWHQLRYYPAHEELRYEAGRSIGGDLGVYRPATVAQRFEVHAIRFAQRDPTVADLLPLLRPALSAGEFADP